MYRNEETKNQEKKRLDTLRGAIVNAHSFLSSSAMQLKSMARKTLFTLMKVALKKKFFDLMAGHQRERKFLEK